MNWPLIALMGYLLVFLFTTLGIAVWRVKQRKERPPVEFKLLRAPGESLRRRIAKFDEDFFFHTFAWAIVPVILAVGFSWGSFKLWEFEEWWHVYAWAVFSILLFALAVLLAMRQVWKKLDRYRSDSLGYLGERFVGEWLAQLERGGYSVFHDVPAEGRKKKFNLDHVVVGATGVWLIETKTRRKGRAREGFEEHVVTFDGKQLIYPWGEDRYGLKQTRREVEYLRDWIETRTGIEITPKGILALPGWMVKEQAKSDVRVLNPKNIPSAIEGRGEQVLSNEQIDQISRQLDLVCRDVED